MIEWRRWSVWLSRMSPKKETIVSRPSSGPIGSSTPAMWIVAVASAVSVVAEQLAVVQVLGGAVAGEQLGDGGVVGHWLSP